MKRLLLFLMFLAGGFTAFGQTTIPIKGVVVNAAGEPLIGVSIQERGTKRATMTLADGHYEISADPGGILVFTYVGFRKAEVAVNRRGVIDVTLKDTEKGLNEVVVIGYGTQKRKDITGAVSSVKGAELAKIPVQNVASALTGQIAGLHVTADDGTPGSEPAIALRGGGSITQDNQPLYVIDGIPQTNGLNFLDPTDVESIEVLKDASATAIYGARGANGVILVTTKQLKPGKLAVSYDMYYGTRKITKELPVLNPLQYTRLMYEKAIDDPLKIQEFENTFGTFNQLDSLYANREGIDWQDQMMGRPSHNQYHKISLSGGSAETRFNLFYSHNDDEGIVMASGAKKNVAKLAVLHNINKKARVSANVNYSDQTITGIGTREGSTKLNQLQNIIQYRPTYGKSGTDDDFLGMDNDPSIDVGALPLQNPVTNAVSQLRASFNRILNLNTTLDYTIANHLTYRGLVGLRVSGTKMNTFNDARSLLAKRSGGPFGSIGQYDESGWNYSNTLTYDNTFKRIHRISVLIGQEQLHTDRSNFVAANSKFPAVNLGLDDLSQGTTPVVPTSYAEAEDMLSFFSRANYSFRDKYILTATIRADGSSKFGPHNRWGYFPSAAFAWRVIEEKFMKSATFLSDLKLRISYGTAGNNRINNYLANSLLQSGIYPVNNSNATTVGASNLPNPNLKWETVQSQNVGLDLGLFGQRIVLAVDAYNNKTKDLLLNALIPFTSGFASQQINIGATSNKGIEIALNTVNIRKNSFEWTSNFNIAFNRNEVLALTSGEKARYSTSWYDQNDYIVKVGSPVGLMYGYQSNNLYTVDDFTYDGNTKMYTLKPGVVVDANNPARPGNLKLVDLNGDGIITPADRTVIGNATPKHTGGFSNTFSYKGIDLSILVNWSFGNDIYNANLLNNSLTYLSYQNTLGYFADRWITIGANGQKVTDPAALAAMNAGKTIPSWNGAGTAIRLYDKMIEDGSFLRVNNISLGYTLPKAWVSKAKISNARIYVTGNNLFVWTKYTGYDPEVSTANTSRLTPGVDFGGYPRARSFIAGLNISL
ncbi:SusC/RagA family TonB-linked outer membrane protein [Chitinophaga sp. RAB17]|uniref:SusC/RagA family TonB-linked outer membrane protein n=1 Tax=Chitinophaga sp. RAB17 TaxID=3233049 RepID=UPI003F909F10